MDEFRIKIKGFIQAGKLYPPKCLKHTDETIRKSFSNGAEDLIKVSLGSGYIIPLAATHLLASSMRNLFDAANFADVKFQVSAKGRTFTSA